jgi:excisionase family DNA binding protein
MNNKSLVLTAKDIMERLKIGKDTAYALMRSESFPSYQLGGRYFISETNFDKWLEDATGRCIVI